MKPDLRDGYSLSEQVSCQALI